jgi:hypothetical protein
VHSITTTGAACHWEKAPRVRPACERSAPSPFGLVAPTPTPRGAPTKSSRSRLAARMAKDAAHPFGNALEKSKCGRSERPTLEHTLPCSSSCVRTCASLRMFCCPRHLLLRVQGLADKAPPMSANIGGWLTAAGFTSLLFGVRSVELGALLGVLLGANLTSWPLPCTGWAMARRRPPL